MDKEYFAKKLGEQFPEFHGAYEEHLEYYEELLGHVFFGGETLLGVLESLLKTNEEKEKIRRYMDFLEDMYANGDDDVQNIVGGHHPGEPGGRRGGAAQRLHLLLRGADAGLPSPLKRAGAGGISRSGTEGAGRNMTGSGRRWRCRDTS